MIPQAFIDDLLQRVDVVEVVGRHVKLRKGGANFMGLCPFHNEKSPSFSVSPTKQFYHCFGCGAHGTALTFLIEYSGFTFPDAVRDLAQSVGMTVPDTRARAHETGGGGGEGAGAVPFDESRSRSTAIIEALEVAAGFYRNTLRGSPRAIDYLKGRGLTGEIAGRFGLGYAPDGWNGLQSAFEDYRSPVLGDAGLVIAKQDDNDEDPAATARVYDRFRDRVMFPIRNTRGRVIGFGGRIIDDGEPKYLNSPETPVFQKGHELYGLFEARQAIREEGFALVVEGYMDVVALAQLGVANAVATLGTACTPNHVQKLLRQTDRVTFSFDGDKAGQKAAWRALEASLPLATDEKALSFLFLPPEHDPDSYIRANGRDAFLDAVKAAVPLSEYVLREIARTNDLRTAEGRAKALFDARPAGQGFADRGTADADRPRARDDRAVDRRGDPRFVPDRAGLGDPTCPPAAHRSQAAAGARAAGADGADHVPGPCPRADRVRHRDARRVRRRRARPDRRDDRGGEGAGRRRRFHRDVRRFARVAEWRDLRSPDAGHPGGGGVQARPAASGVGGRNPGRRRGRPTDRTARRVGPRTARYHPANARPCDQG